MDDDEKMPEGTQIKFHPADKQRLKEALGPL